MERPLRRLGADREAGTGTPPGGRLAPFAALAACLALAGCGSLSEMIAERASEAPGIGLPTGTPERPAAPPSYPAVHDMPPARPAALMTEEEQKRAENELLAARARHQAGGGAPATPPATPAVQRKPADGKPAPKQAPSSRQIY